MQLSDLTNQFLGLMNRGDLTGNTALTTTFINQAIIRLQRELRLPFMEKIIEYTIPNTYNPATGLVIPSDLLELIDINVDSDGDGIMDYPLQRVNLRDAQVASQLVDVPRIFSRKGGNWVIGPQPAVGIVVEIVYYAEFAPLINPTDTNTISNIAWDAVCYGALSAACDYYNDDRAQKFESRYAQITEMLQNQADADELTADAAIRPALRFGDNWTQYDGMVE
jgi:hypothetical protein